MARILLVDDEPDLRFLMARFLEADGHEVEHASNGKVGLEMLRATTFDLVVTDNVMPVMNGEELIRRIREDADLQDILIVAWSINPDHELPVDALFAKPYGGQEIRERINELLAEDR